MTSYTSTSKTYYSRSRSPSPYGKYRMFAPQSTEEDLVINQMCRPPAGWPSSGGVPPLPDNSSNTQRQSRNRVSWRDSLENQSSSIPSKEFDKTFKTMEGEVSQLHSYMDNFVHKMDRLVTDTFRKRSSSEGRRPVHDVRITDSSEASPEPIESVDERGDKKLVYNFELDGFRPEDIKVNLNTDDGVVTIEACREERDRERYIKRSYSRKFSIPDELREAARRQSLKSFLNEDGILSIEAPLPRPASSWNTPAPYPVNTTYRVDNCNSNINRSTSCNSNFRNNNNNNQTLPDYYCQKKVEKAHHSNQETAPSYSSSNNNNTRPCEVYRTITPTRYKTPSTAPSVQPTLKRNESFELNYRYNNTYC